METNKITAGAQVIGWPFGGTRPPFWVLDYTPGRGFYPVAGPFDEAEKAEKALEDWLARVCGICGARVVLHHGRPEGTCDCAEKEA